MAGSSDFFHHVRDYPYFELPDALGGHLNLPEIAGFQVTKYMVLSVVAAALTLLLFWVLSRKIRDGKPVKGVFWNFWEAIVLTLRDEVVRPTIGTGHHDHGDEHAISDHHHADDYGDGQGNGGTGGMGGVVADQVPMHLTTPSGRAVPVAHPADRHLPFILSVFFFVLFCNLLGMLPWLGSPTADLGVTAMLAGIVFLYVVAMGVKASGGVGYLKSLMPDLGLEGPMNVGMTILLWPIELLGLLIKHAVLAVRLFANLMAGHTVIGVFLGFIGTALAQDALLKYSMIAGSIGMQVFISLLELFVAFLQAYVFAFLTTLFISASENPH